MFVSRIIYKTVRDLPRSSVKREGAFVSLILTRNNTEIDEIMRAHSKTLEDTSAVNGSQYSRSFSGHVPVPTNALWSTCCAQSS